MLEILKKKQEELKNQLVEQTITDEEIADVDRKVSAYREELMSKLMTEKEVKSKQISIKLETVEELIAEIENSTSEEETYEEVEDEEAVEQTVIGNTIPRY